MHKDVAICYTTLANRCILMEKNNRNPPKPNTIPPTPQKKENKNPTIKTPNHIPKKNPKPQWAAISFHGEDSYSMCLFPGLCDHDFQRQFSELLGIEVCPVKTFQYFLLLFFSNKTSVK